MQSAYYTFNLLLILVDQIQQQQQQHRLCIMVYSLYNIIIIIVDTEHKRKFALWVSQHFGRSFCKSQWDGMCCDALSLMPWIKWRQVCVCVHVATSIAINYDDNDNRTIQRKNLWANLKRIWVRWREKKNWNRRMKQIKMRRSNRETVSTLCGLAFMSKRLHVRARVRNLIIKQKSNGKFLVEVQVPSQRAKPSHRNRGVININQMRLLFCISAHLHRNCVESLCDEWRNTGCKIKRSQIVMKT